MPETQLAVQTRTRATMAAIGPSIVRALLVLLILLAPGLLQAQSGDALYGKEMLEVRRCTVCHSVEGVGGGKAPDLGKPSPKDISPAGVAAAMWNHGPQMWQQMADQNQQPPMLTWQDVANLYAYMYSVRYFDPPGDAAHGAQVFASKSCSACHALKASDEPGVSAPAGPPVSTWLSMADPVSWMQQMWNHAAGMGDQIEQKGNAWPQFQLQEMADLLAYLEHLPELRLANPGMAFGDVQSGRDLFAAKGCAECHSLGPSETGKVDLLAAARQEPRLSGLAVKMWNHRPVMSKAAREKNVELQTFENGEMSDLLAYLFEQGYFSVRGDADQGQPVYEAKCGSCHETGDAETPQLRGTGAPFTATRLGAAVWAHGPNMKAQMNYRQKGWPTLTEREAADLIAYLNGQ